MSLADEREGHRILWYGDPGTNKTTALASIANRGKMVLVDADQGLKARPLRDLGVNVENIDPFRQIDYPALDGMVWDVRAALDDDPDSVVALGFDTVTEITSKLLEAIVDKQQGAKITKAERQGLDASDIDPFFRDIAYYGTMTEQMRRLTRHARDLGIHVGFTAHVRRDIDESTSKVQYGPAVSPSYQSDLMGYVDIIAYCRVDGQWPDGFEVAGREGLDVMVADLRRTNTHHAKDRFHVTPPVLVNPTFDRLIQYIEGELTPDTDEQMDAYRELWQQRRRDERAAKDAKMARQQRGARKTAAPAATKDTATPEESDSSEAAGTPEADTSEA